LCHKRTSTDATLANNLLAHREQFDQSRPRRTRQHVDATVQFQAALKQATDYFMAHGSALAQAHQQALNWIAQQVQTQVALLAYIDVFWALILISIAAVPLALTLRR
jgi:DHA2 family multidrug resistance protein